MGSRLLQDLTGQVALVTGATGGIGQATVRALAAANCTVAIHFHAAKEKAEELVKEVHKLGVKAQAYQADLGTYDDARRLHNEVVQSLGHPTILYLNAGTTAGKSGIKDIQEISMEDFERTWRANCATPCLLAQLCMPSMVEKGFGRVIFCSSVAGFAGGVVGPHYASSKSALHGLIHWLASAYAKQGITVNGVAPALIADTTMLPGSNEALASRIPIGRLGKPEEIADTVMWMIRNSYVTNKVFAVDGGLFVQ